MGRSVDLLLGQIVAYSNPKEDAADLIEKPGQNRRPCSLLLLCLRSKAEIKDGIGPPSSPKLLRIARDRRSDANQQFLLTSAARREDVSGRRLIRQSLSEVHGCEAIF